MPEHRITRHFVTVGDRQVHYRRLGEGPPVLLVHESPMTGVMLLPLARALADLGHCVLALDTAGYGGSDLLTSTSAPTIADYADAIVELFEPLGLDRPYVYGSHTGAQIVLELGLRHPKAARSIVVDGLPAFTRAEAIDLRMNWLIQYPPQSDGTHLVALWHRYRDHVMFWPFYRPTDAGRFELDLPSAEHFHERLVDWLLPGELYPLSYNAAFDYEGHFRVAELKARAALTAHFDDLLGKYTDQLPAKLGRDTVKARMPKAEHPRWIADFLAGAPSPDAPPAPAAVPIAGRLSREYAADGQRQLLVRRRLDAPGRPLVLIPDAPDAGSGLRALADALAETRPVVILDVPGTGGSDPLARKEPAVADLVASLDRAIRSLGVKEADLYGRGVGAVLALELARARPKAVGRLVLDGFPLWSPDVRKRFLAQPRVSLTPETDGTHLLRAWTMTRDREVFFPWFERTRANVRKHAPAPPAEIHRRVLELLKALPTYDLPERAALAHPLEDALASIPVPAMAVAAPGEVAANVLVEVGRLAGIPATVLSGDAATDARAIARFLDGDAA